MQGGITKDRGWLLLAWWSNRKVKDLLVSFWRNGEKQESLEYKKI